MDVCLFLKLCLDFSIFDIFPTFYHTNIYNQVCFLYELDKIYILNIIKCTSTSNDLYFVSTVRNCGSKKSKPSSKYQTLNVVFDKLRARKDIIKFETIDITKQKTEIITMETAYQRSARKWISAPGLTGTTCLDRGKN